MKSEKWVKKMKITKWLLMPVLLLVIGLGTIIVGGIVILLTLLIIFSLV